MQKADERRPNHLLLFMLTEISYKLVLRHFMKCVGRREELGY